jgi:hypothetical protein
MSVQLKKLLACLLLIGIVGCSAEDVRNDGERTAEDEAYIEELDSEIDAAEGGEAE